MKHQAVSEALLAHFHSPWMNDGDKAEFNREALKAAGLTMEQMDAAIEIGVSNGYSVEVQLAMIEKILKSEKK